MAILRSASTYTPLLLIVCWMLFSFANVNTGVAQEKISLAKIATQPIVALENQSAPADLKNWLMVPYDTENLSGQLMGESIISGAKDISVPLNHQGWFTIVLGVWNPDPKHSLEPSIQARLASENKPSWVRFKPSHTQEEVDSLTEVPFCSANLTDEAAIFIGRSAGLQPRSAYVAYVKLVPLSDTKVKEILAEKAKEPESHQFSSRVVAPNSPAAAR